MRVGNAETVGFANGRLASGPNGGTVARRREIVEIDAAGVDWVCVAVRPGREFRVADDLAEGGFRVFCPHGVRVSHRARDRSSLREKRVYAERDYPVFGAYVFVGQPPELLLARSSHRHILRVLDEGRAFVPPRLIRDLAHLWTRGVWDLRRKVAAKFQRGDEVWINSGALAGFNGVVERLSKETRAVVLFSLFGRQTEVTIDCSDLEMV